MHSESKAESLQVADAADQLGARGVLICLEANPGQRRSPAAVHLLLHLQTVALNRT